MFDVLVFDTSTLQAMHRAGVLPSVIDAAPIVVIPAEVERETRRAFKKVGPTKAPNLDDLPFIQVLPVFPKDFLPLRFRPLALPPKMERRPSAKPLCQGFVLDQGELEVVALAYKIHHEDPDVTAVAVIDDKKAGRCARLSGVPYMTEVDLLEILAPIVGEGVETLKKRLRARGYFPSR